MKLILSNSRNTLSTTGIVNRLDSWIDQELTTESSVQFDDMSLTGNLNVAGNVTIHGNQTIIEAQTVRIQDNLIEINADNPMPLNQAGIAIHRGGALPNAQILWNESSQTFQVGTTSQMKTLAVRPSTGMVNGGIVTYDASTDNMTSTTTITPSITMSNAMVASQGVFFGTAPSRPSITGNTAGALQFVSPNNFQFQTSTSNARIMIPDQTQLDFNSGQSTLYCDQLGRLICTTTEFRPTRVGWSSSVHIESPDSSTLRLSGDTIELAAQNPISLTVPLRFSNNATIEALPGNILEISSPGDISLNPTGLVRIPSLSINDNRVRFITDTSGNLTLETDGNITFNPLSDIIVPSGKSLNWGTSTKSAKIISGDLALSSDTSIVLSSSTGTKVLGTLYVNTSTLTTDISENLTLSSQGNILFTPTGYLKVPESKNLYFGDTQYLYGSSQNLYATAALDIVLATGRNVVIPQSRNVTFGNTANLITSNPSNEMVIQTSAGLYLNTPVRLAGNTLTFQNATITQTTVNGDLVLTAPGAGSVKSASRVEVTSTINGTTMSTADLAVNGSAVINGPLVASDLSVSSSITTPNGSFQLNPLATPVVSLDSPSSTDGTLLSLSASYDRTSGYTVGRGTSTTASGRAMTFTLPDYVTEYSSSGTRPSFMFGSSGMSDWILTMNSLATTLQQGSFVVQSSSATAVSIPNGGLSANTITTPQLTVASGTLTASTSAVTVTTPFNVNNATLIAKNSSNVSVFTVDPNNTISTTLPMSHSGTLTRTGATILNGTLTVNDIVQFTESLSMSNKKITSLGTPVDAADAANKAYVDAMSQGMTYKEAVIAATTGTSIDLSQPLLTLDSVTLVAGDRVLIKDQTTTSENGIYMLQPSLVPMRTLDFDAGDQVAGAAVFVSSGTSLAGSGYVVQGTSVVVDSDPVNWTAFTGISSVLTGTAISKSGNTLSVLVDDLSIGTNGSNQLTIKQSAAGTGISVTPTGIIETTANQSHVTQVGTLTVGTWNASTVGVQYGGTGLSSISQGRLLYGGSSNTITTGQLVYTTDNRFGIGTTSPSASIHVVEPTNDASVRLISTNSTPQNVSLTMGNTNGNASLLFSASDNHLTLANGTLTGSLIFATNGTPQMTISSNGQVSVGTSPVASHQMTLSGTLYSSQGATLGSITIPNVGTIGPHPQLTTELQLDSSTVNLTGALVTSQSSRIGNLRLITGTTNTAIQSTNSSTGLGIPLQFNLLPGITCATAYGQTGNTGFHVSQTLLIGGVYTDETTGYRARLSGTTLSWTPGTSNMLMSMAGNVAFEKQLYFRDTTNNQVHVGMSGTNLIMKSMSSSDSTLKIGSAAGSSELSLMLMNRAEDRSVTWDAPSGTLTMDAPVIFNMDMNVKSLLYDATKGQVSTLDSLGYYYLGTLGIGRTTIEMSTSWTAQIQYDGVSTPEVKLSMRNRNDAHLIIYKNGTVAHAFIYVANPPLAIRVLEASAPLSLVQFEGTSLGTPDGTYSSYSNTWVLAYNSASAVGSATLEVGALTAAASASLTNLTTTGSTTMTGSLTLNGNLTATGTQFDYLIPLGNLMSLASDVNQNNSMTLYARDLSSATMVFNRTSANASISVPAIGAVSNPSALVISHNTASSTSKIVFQTRATPRMTLTDAGALQIHTTTETTGANDGALVIAGGAYVAKTLFAAGKVTTPNITLKNATTGLTSVISNTSAGDISVNFKRITDVADPTADSDAVHKRYVDLAIQGMAAKEAVVAASVGNVDISMAVTVLDDVTIPYNSRILLKDQSNAVENGIYVTQSSGPPVRAADMANGSNAATSTVFVSQGTQNNTSVWLCSNQPSSDIVGVNALTFVQFSGASQIAVGPGLTKTGNQIDVVVDNQSIETFGGALRVSANIAGDGLTGGSGLPLSVNSIAHLDTVGVIRTGTWQADPIEMQYGGTGTTAFTANAIPFSNGLRLTQGQLVFDNSTNRLGINTTAPTHGLTMVDRNVHLIQQNSSSVCHLLTTVTANNYSFAQRQSGQTLVWSSGSGTDPSALTDRVQISSTGTLNALYGVVTPSATLNTNYVFNGNSLTRTTSGAMNLALGNSSASENSITMYGSVGTPSSTTNAEFVRIGYTTTAGFHVLTRASGTGQVRPLTLRAGENMTQLVLNADNSVSTSGKVLISDTTDATIGSSTGALYVMGGAQIDKTLLVNNLSVSGSFNLIGGFTLSSALLLNGQVSYSAASSSTENAFKIQNTASTGDMNSILELSGNDTSLQSNVLTRYFAKGTTITDNTSKYLSVGYSYSAGGKYVLNSNTTDIQLVLGAGQEQIAMSSSGVLIDATTTITHPLTISSTNDASSALNGGAATISGGLAVAKTLIVGTGATIPTTHITTRIEISNAGSADRVAMSYSGSGVTNMYNSTTTRLQMHAHQSDGPESLNTEYLNVGYHSSSAHAVMTNATGTGVVRDLILGAGTSTTMTLQASSNAISSSALVRFTNTTDATSTTTASMIVSGGLAVNKNLYANSGLSLYPNQTSGTLLDMAGLYTAAVTSGTNIKYVPTTSSSSMTYRNATDTTTILGMTNNSLTSGVPNTIATTSTTAFTVANASNNAVFTVDTTNNLINAGGSVIQNTADPLVASDVATKKYVDNVAKGLNLKEAVTCASTSSNIIDLLNPVTTIDGVTLFAGDRVLLKNQSDPIQNGIYRVTAGNYLVRADDLFTGAHAAGVFCFIQKGTLNADKGYVCTADRPDDVVDTDPLTFTQFNSNTITVSNGLVKSPDNVVSINLAANSSLDFTGGALRVASTIAGSGLELVDGSLNVLPISNVGTVTTGTWRATPIETAFGGTGNTSFIGTSLVFAASSGTQLTSDSKLQFNATNKTLGINLSSAAATSDALAVAAKDISVYDGSLILGSATMVQNWKFSHVPTTGDASHLVLSRGSGSGFTESLIVTSSGKVGIGYTSPTSITDTFMVQGTATITGAVTLQTQLTVPNGGTGATTLPYGLVIGNGTSALTTTGTLSDGQVPIGSSSGTITLESGATLRAHIGLAIGTDVQAYHENLSDISGLNPSTDAFIVGNGSAFTTLTYSAARTALQLGSLATLNTIDNSNFSGTPLSIANGGTGTDGSNYTSNQLVMYQSSPTAKFTTIGVSWNSTTSTLVLGGTPPTTPEVSTALHVYDREISLQASSSTAQTGMSIQQSDGQYLWRMYKNASSEFSIAGGAASASRSSLTDRITIKQSGVVVVQNTDNATSTTTGALQVRGGLAVSAAVYANSASTSHIFTGAQASGTATMRVQNTTNETILEVNDFILTSNSTNNIISSANKDIELSAPTGTIRVTGTTISTTPSTGSMVLSGGLGVRGSVNVASDITASSATTRGTFFTVHGATFTESTNASTLTNVSASLFSAPIMDSSVACTTDIASTLFVNGAPVATGNMTITNALAFRVSGLSQLDNVKIVNTTDATALGQGALVLSSGGLSVAQQLRVGGLLTSTNSAVFQKSITASRLATPSSTSESSTLGHGTLLNIATSSLTDITTADLTTVPELSSVFLKGTTYNSTNSVQVTRASTLYIEAPPVQSGNTTITSTRALTVASGTSEFGGQLLVTATTQSTSTATGSVVVSGGAAIQKNLYVAGDLVVTGSFTSTGNVDTPTLSPSALSGTSTVTPRRVKLYRNGTERSLKAVFEVVPNASSLLVSFRVTLPERASQLADLFDISAITDAFTMDNTIPVKVFNSNAIAVTGTSSVLVQFQSRDTTSHYITVSLDYSI